MDRSFEDESVQGGRKKTEGDAVELRNSEEFGC